MEQNFRQPPDWKSLVPSNKKDYSPHHLGYDVDEITLSEADDFDIGIIGEPYDRGHLIRGRPGARDGPKEIRKAIANTKSYNLSNGIISCDIGDLGDISIPMGISNEDAHKYIKNVNEIIYEHDFLPIFLGGDHSLVYPNVSPLIDNNGSVGVINFDSHDDLHKKINNQPHTASPFRQLVDDGLQQYTIVGAREFGVAEPSANIMDDIQGDIISAEEIGMNVKDSVDKIMNTMSDVETIFVSIDIDVIDMGIVPGTSSPYPGGLLPRELFYILRNIAKENKIAGVDIVEVAPILELGTPHESKGVKTTSNIAGRAISHFISGAEDREGTGGMEAC